MINKKEIQFLFQKYLDGNSTSQEVETLVAYFGVEDDGQALSALVQQYMERDVHFDQSAQQRIQNVVLKSDKTMQAFIREVHGLPSRRRFWLYAAAASILILLSAGLFYFKQIHEPYQSGLSIAQDIAPGGNRATLTLPNGTAIPLNNDQSEILIQEDAIVYADGSFIASSFFDKTTQGANESDRLLTLQTPNGGQYQVTLPDGTKVWLNAGSTLKYPSRFTSASRRVELNGEAYFEVAHIKKAPFIVASKGQEITVLGTHFNVNAYEDEPTTKTTLLQGVVQVSTLDGASRIRLQPNEQSILSSNRKMRVNAVDAREAIAWQKGYFVFANENIKSIMRKVARWYDVAVVYESGVENKAIGGTVSRYKNVSEVLSMLAETKAVRFKVEDKTITVLPY